MPTNAIARIEPRFKNTYTFNPITQEESPVMQDFHVMVQRHKLTLTEVQGLQSKYKSYLETVPVGEAVGLQLFDTPVEV